MRKARGGPKAGRVRPHEAPEQEGTTINSTASRSQDPERSNNVTSRVLVGGDSGSQGRTGVTVCNAFSRWPGAEREAARKGENGNGARGSYLCRVGEERQGNCRCAKT